MLEDQRFHRQLAAMTQIEEISTAVGTVSWLWGGFVADIYSGHLLRAHHDLDYLTKDLFNLIPVLEEQLRRVDWQTKRAVNGDLLAHRDDVRMHLGHVTYQNEANACWIHNGDKGRLLFPRQWLPQTVVSFYQVDLHVVAPNFQYSLYQRPEQLNVAWQRRPQDQEACAILEEIVAYYDGCRQGLR